MAHADLISALITLSLAIPAVAWMVADYRHGALTDTDEHESTDDRIRRAMVRAGVDPDADI